MSTAPQPITSPAKLFQTKEILSDSINIYLTKPSRLSSVTGKRSSQSRLSSSTTYRSKDITHRIDHNLNTDSMSLEAEILKTIEEFQDDQLRTEEAKLRREMYNAKQTPLIPLIADLDLDSLDQLSQEQNDLLSTILGLFKDTREMCSFFEQFEI